MDTKDSTAIRQALIPVSEAKTPMNSEQIAHSVGTNASYIRRWPPSRAGRESSRDAR